MDNQLQPISDESYESDGVMVSHEPPTPDSTNVYVHSSSDQDSPLSAKTRVESIVITDTNSNNNSNDQQINMVQDSVPSPSNHNISISVHILSPEPIIPNNQLQAIIITEPTPLELEYNQNKIISPSRYNSHTDPEIVDIDYQRKHNIGHIVPAPQINIMVNDDEQKHNEIVNDNADDSEEYLDGTLDITIGVGKIVCCPCIGVGIMALRTLEGCLKGFRDTWNWSFGQSCCIDIDRGLKGVKSEFLCSKTFICKCCPNVNY